MRLQGTTITGNIDNPDIGGAVTVARASSPTKRGRNDIENIGTEPAIGVYHGSHLRQDTASVPVTGIISGGLTLLGDSYGELRQAVVSGGVRVDLGSTARIGSGSERFDPSQTVINDVASTTIEAPVQTSISRRG